MKVGFMGLGQMGRHLATNVHKAGFDLMVYDIVDEQAARLGALGAKVARSPREIGEHGEIIALAVPDDAAVNQALLGDEGALSTAKPGTIIAIHSTIHPETALHLAEVAKPKGITVLDTQMSGGQTGAEAATLVFMVGGDVDAFEKVRPMLEASGTNIFHMGALGMGAAAKVAQQAITTINIMAAAEGFRLAEAAGVKLDSFEKLLGVSAGQSYMTDRWLERYREFHSTDPRPFYRGLRAVLKMAFDLDVPAPATALAQQTIPWVLASDA